MNTAPALLLASIDPKVDVKAIEQQLKIKETELTHFNNVEILEIEKKIVILKSL
jgi:general secretion pathway protein K